MINYPSIESVFDILNANDVQYLVLRNFENLLSPDMYLDGHGDIDLLCIDSQQIVGLLDAGSDRPDTPPYRGDGVHYFIMVNNQKVSLDLRYVGDDYYCKEWEDNLLLNRVRFGCFYVMDKVNYFYTLVYHAILQKRSFSEEYRSRLTQMASCIGCMLSDTSESGFLRLLEDYMRANQYKFVFSKDYLVPNRFSLVDKSLVATNRKRRNQHRCFEIRVSIIETLVWIKHQLIKN